MPEIKIHDAFYDSPGPARPSRDLIENGGYRVIARETAPKPGQIRVEGWLEIQQGTDQKEVERWGALDATAEVAKELKTVLSALLEDRFVPS